MAGYIGSKASVSVVSPETDSRYVNVTGDTMNGTLLVGNVARNVDGIRIQSNQAGTSYGIRIGSDGSTDPLEFWREHSSGDQKQFSVDYFGRVTMPYQPAFLAYPSANYTVSTGITDIPCDATVFNTGNHFNTTTNRFTAPVTGKYVFFVTIAMDSTASTWTYLSSELLVNNAQRYGGGWLNKSGSGYGRTHYAIVLSLSASDYVVPRTEMATSSLTALSGLTGRHTSFSGYLIG